MMKTTTARTVIALLAASAACLATAVPAARGGLFATLSYDHAFGLAEPGNGTARNAGAELTGVTLPVQKTESLSQVYTSGSATYAFTDDGTTAALRVNCQGQISGATNSEVGEGVGGFQDRFTLAQPASYVATFSNTGGYDEVNLTGGDLSNDFDIYGTQTTLSHSGTLPAGVSLAFFEDWSLANTYAGAPASLSGASSVSIVFTAVPEPASAAGVAVAGGAALLARRRQ